MSGSEIPRESASPRWWSDPLGQTPTQRMVSIDAAVEFLSTGKPDQATWQTSLALPNSTLQCSLELYYPESESELTFSLHANNHPQESEYPLGIISFDDTGKVLSNFPTRHRRRPDLDVVAARQLIDESFEVLKERRATELHLAAARTFIALGKYACREKSWFSWRKFRANNSDMIAAAKNQIVYGASVKSTTKTLDANLDDDTTISLRMNRLENSSQDISVCSDVSYEVKIRRGPAGFMLRKTHDGQLRFGRLPSFDKDQSPPVNLTSVMTLPNVESVAIRDALLALAGQKALGAAKI